MITASGRMLPPFLIIKGKPGGQIEWEFSIFPEDGFYACQKKAWVDEHLMKAWVEQILKHIHPANQMGLSSFFCRKCTIVIWWSPLPPSSNSGEWKCCTSQVATWACASSSMLASKSYSSLKYKSCERTGWWILTWVTITLPSTWLDVAEWVMEAYYLPEQIVCKMKKGYVWFTNGKEVEDRNWGMHGGDDDVFSMMMQMLIHLLIWMCLRVELEGLRENKIIYLT